MFSKACEYAIKATLLIASNSLSGKRISVKDIAKETGSPLPFTAKVLQQLARQGIIQSVQGIHGGFEIGRKELQETRLIEIVTTIDGVTIFTSCGLGLKACNALKPCPMHHRFAAVRGELKAMLEETTVMDLALGLKDGLSFLNR